MNAPLLAVLLSLIVTTLITGALGDDWPPITSYSITLPATRSPSQFHMLYDPTGKGELQWVHITNMWNLYTTGAVLTKTDKELNKLIK